MNIRLIFNYKHIPMQLLKSYKFTFFMIVFFSGIMVSCSSDEQCRENKNVVMQADFYHVAFNATTQTYSINKITIDSITVQGLKRDSITGNEVLIDSVLYNNSKSLSSLNLPLNKFQGESKFLLRINGINDTLVIYHTNQNQYLSLQCGCIKTFNIDTIISTHHFIDSTSIVLHQVNTNNAENIRLFN